MLSRSGGIEAFVTGATRVASTRRRVQTTSWFAGLVIFFDDYANSLLMGSMLRSLADRLRISREKLAFLIDSTAAPVAGLAVVSTWIGVEVSNVQIGLSSLGLEEATSSMAYATFLETLPYRFYPVLALAFVLMVALSGKDFGPMARAEAAAARRPREETESDEAKPIETKPSWINLLIPFTLLIGLLVWVMWATGLESLQSGETHEEVNWRTIITHADSYDALLISAYGAGLAAVLLAWGSRALPLGGAVESWLEGVQRMLPGVLVLVLAWGLATICDKDHLQTANCLVSLTGDDLHPAWMPAIVFLLSAAVSFATGSSWSTMALLIPVSISLQYQLIVQNGTPFGTLEEVTAHPQMLGVIGSVLAGSLFGDHCSPISDTTVLSSIAAECDHLAHVRTQLPYALAVGVVSLLVGSIPAGWSVPPIPLMLIGAALLAGLLLRFGRTPEETRVPPDESV